MVDWEGLKASEAKATPGPWKAISRLADANSPMIYSGEMLINERQYILTGLWPIHEPTTKATKDAERITFANTEFVAMLRTAFPTILAAHERDQRVILAAEKLREDILTINRDAWQGEGAICRSIARQSDAALATFDKAKL